MSPLRKIKAGGSAWDEDWTIRICDQPTSIRLAIATAAALGRTVERSESRDDVRELSDERDEQDRDFDDERSHHLQLPSGATRERVSDLDDVPLSELALQIIAHGGTREGLDAIALDNIQKEVARLYGVSRLREQARTRLRSAAELAATRVDLLEM